MRNGFLESIAIYYLEFSTHTELALKCLTDLELLYPTKNETINGKAFLFFKRLLVKQIVSDS